MSADDARLTNALMNMDRSRFDAAERQVMDLLADDPADANAQKLLLVIQARRLRSQFDFERAMQKYRAVLKLDPEHTEAKQQLDALGDELAHSQALFNRVFGSGDEK
jgi:Tfp pilus assembly protein PilF